MFYFLLLIAVLIGAYALYKARGYQIRQKLLSKPLLDGEWDIVLEQVPLCRKLPPELRSKLEGKINLFLDQVEFIGCNGVEVTDEMELSIAAQASLLVANTDMWFKTLQTILIYPNAFKSRQTVQQGYVHTEREITRIGESWGSGPVVLSWAHTEKGAQIEDDAHNVVIHEFAHQLDALSGYTNGAPVLKKGHRFADWDRALTAAYRRLVKEVQDGRKPCLDPYGATAPEEFFAVAVETFFEQPHTLQAEEPEVYAQLSKFFELDPLKWA
jgi:Mlc titration factor MtfA (ptsG expression regulator)